MIFNKINCFIKENNLKVLKFLRFFIKYSKNMSNYLKNINDDKVNYFY